jgi:hypothetical protein
MAEFEVMVPASGSAADQARHTEEAEVQEEFLTRLSLSRETEQLRL